jgi:hypothetical protein
MADVRCASCGASHAADDAFCPRCGAGRRDTAAVEGCEVPDTTSERAALFTELQQALAPRIQLAKELGSGGMGTVFLGRDPALKRLVVVKVLLPELAHDPSARARFAREAESAAAVSHPNVVSVFQVGELPTSCTIYFVMQFVDGPTLQQAFPAGQAVPEPQARRVIGEVASALAAAHARGLIHRDIKPSNIMIERETGRAVVLDFGISAALGARARAQTEKLTVQGTSIGTPEYMSPEQAAAEEVTEHSDVYSLGVVGFELLTGRLPFAGGSPMALAAAHIKDAPPTVRSLRPDLDPQLAELIDRCLRKVPADRPSADDIARTLLVASTATVEWPPPGLERLIGQGRVQVRLVAALACAVVLMLLVLSYGFAGDSPAWYRDSDQGQLTYSPLSWAVSPVLGLAGFALLVAILYTGTRFAASLRWARAAGYPWGVLFDVAMDRGPDTGHLLSGTGPYGLIDRGARQRLRRNRRWSAVAQLVGLAACVPGGLAFLFGWLPEPVDPVVLISVPQLAWLAALPMIAWLCSVLLREREAQLRRGLEWLVRLPRLRRPPIRAELVAAWLGSVQREAPQDRGPLTLTGPAFLPLFGVLVVGAALLVPVALASGSSIFGKLVLGQGQGRRDALELLRDTRQSSEQRRWHRLDSLLAVAGQGPGTGVRGRAAADTLMLLAIPRQQAQILWVGDDDVRAMVQAAYPPVPRSSTDTSLWRALPGRLTDEQRRALVADTLSPRLHLWRLFAGADSLPPLWMVRPGFGQWIGDEDAMADERTRASYRSTLLDLAQRNMAAAILAMDRGDVATALLRTRQNVAAARTLQRQPLMALSQLVGIGRVSLREVARLSGDSALRSTAAALDEVTTVREHWWLADWALMADPLEPPGLLIVADTFAPPARRWRAIEAAVRGVCTNTREVLFGASARRMAVLERAAVAARDVPRTDEWVAVQRRRLERFDRLSPLARIRRCLNAGAL